MFKKSLTFLLAFLLISPQVQAHKDVLVYQEEVPHETLEMFHSQKEDVHKNDTHDEQNSTHHHHCTTVTVLLDFVAPSFNYVLIARKKRKTTPFSYQKQYSDSVLDTDFHPPIATV